MPLCLKYILVASLQRAEQQSYLSSMITQRVCDDGKTSPPQVVLLGRVSPLLCFKVHQLFFQWPSQLKYNPFKYLRCYFAIRKNLIVSN